MKQTKEALGVQFPHSEIEYNKQLKLYAYEVGYIDIREPKPRTCHISIAVYDEEQINALAALGINITDFITDNFNRNGFYVECIRKFDRKVLTVSLSDLYFNH